MKYGVSIFTPNFFRNGSGFIRLLMQEKLSINSVQLGICLFISVLLIEHGKLEVLKNSILLLLQLFSNHLKCKKKTKWSVSLVERPND